MKFSEIPAHENVKEQLKALVDSDRLPHALLLEGPAGIGKMMMARALAQYIHCSNRTPDGDSCGRCPACLQHESFNHIDTHYSFPFLKKKSGSMTISDDYLEEWREFLKSEPYMNFATWQEMLGNADGQPVINVDESQSLIQKLRVTAHDSNYIVVILWLPERMNEQCANKLLKLIEEPHEDTRFILVSNESSKILPTIYSRLQRIEMKRLPDNVISDYLIENLAIDPAEAANIAHLAEGSILNARKRVDSQDTDRQYFELFVSAMRDAYQRKIHDLRKWSETVAAMGREKCMKFLEYCERLIGENYIYNLANPEIVYLDRDEAAFSKNFARFIDYRNVEELRKLFMDARRDIAGNGNAKIVMFDVAIHLIMYIKKSTT